MTAIAFIGFGEAGQALGPGLGTARAYDRRTDLPATRAAKQDDYRRLGIRGCDSHAEAVAGAAAILSLVTADQALAAAAESAASLTLGTLFLDMNSVAPDTKRRAAQGIEAAGGRYVDVAVMAPVLPARRAVPLLVSGPHGTDALALLVDLGFANARLQPGAVGAASAVKMIRSVMVKGLEALSAECALAADAAGVLDEVVASLDASWPGADWARRFDYHLDRMMVHGVRRAEEMGEVVATLDALGTGSAMSRGTAVRQREIGARGLTPPAGLAAKLRALAPHDRQEAA